MSEAGLNNHDVFFAPGRLWSLWDMLQPYAHHALIMGRAIGMVLTTAELAAQAFPASVSKINAAIQELPNDGPLDSILLNSLRRQFDRMVKLLTKPDTTLEAMAQSSIELANRVHDALIEQQFLHVPMVEFYNSHSLFGAEVEDKFQNVSEDISESGKCIALGRYTASVFHLMRAMESVVHSIGIRLNVTVVDKDNADLEWGKILGNLKTTIEAKPKGKEKDDWSAAFTLLVHVKQAWRNPTMHPKKTYTEEEAKEIFAATRSFMNSLSALV